MTGRACVQRLDAPDRIPQEVGLHLLLAAVLHARRGCAQAGGCVRCSSCTTRLRVSPDTRAMAP